MVEVVLFVELLGRTLMIAEGILRLVQGLHFVCSIQHPVPEKP